MITKFTCKKCKKYCAEDWCHKTGEKCICFECIPEDKREPIQPIPWKQGIGTSIISDECVEKLIEIAKRQI